VSISVRNDTSQSVWVLQLEHTCAILKKEEDDELEWAQTHFFIVWKQ
jgi:hypothetical protein